MTGLHQAWRDALQDLGVMGLIPVPRVADPDVHPEAVPIVTQMRPPAGEEKTSTAMPLRTPPPPPPRPQPAPAPAKPLPDPKDPVAFPPPERVASCCSLEELDSAVKGCLACPLGAHRLRFVFGEGNALAKILLIGEGPGRDEDLQGRPFVGKAGELLDKMLGAVGLDRTQVYIANVVKCRPPDNRTPAPEEAQRCLPYLRRQIELIRPAVIITLGATPLRELLGVTTGITRIRGQWQRLDLLGGIPVMPTFHPAYVLRQYTQEVRRAVWSDLVAAKKWLDDSGPVGS
jgi:DNA polymerase